MYYVESVNHPLTECINKYKNNLVNNFWPQASNLKKSF